MNTTPQEILFRQNARSVAPPAAPDEDARLSMRIQRGDAVAELGAGILSQQMKIELGERGAGENYAFGDSPVFIDEDGDGVDDRKEEEKSYRRSVYQTIINEFIDDTLSAIDSALAKNAEAISLTRRDLADIRQRLEQNERALADLAPQIAAQKDVVANQQLAVDTAQKAALEQAAQVKVQEGVVAQKQTEVTVQEGVQKAAAQDVVKKEAVLTESLAKSDTVINAARAANGVTDDGAVVESAAEAKAEVDALDKYRDEIRARYDAKGVVKEFDLIEKWRKDPASVSLEDAQAAAEKIRAAGLTTDRTTELAKILKEKEPGNAFLKTTEAARAENRSNLSAVDLARDVLKTETEKLDTLKTRLAEEQVKLDAEKKLLTDKEARLAQEKEKLANDKAKLAELEAQEKTLLAEREQLKAREQEAVKKLEQLESDRAKLEAAKAKFSDPDYRRKAESGEISKAQLLKDIQDLPLSETEKKALITKLDAAGPTPPKDDVSVKGSTAAAPETAKPSAPGTGSISAANGDGKGLKDTNMAQTAFEKAASGKVAVTNEDELAPKVTAPAVKVAAAPSSAMV